LIASIGLTTGLHPDFGTVWNGAPNGIPYDVVASSQAKVPVSFQYASESDPGPYPVPPDAPIEGGASSSGDRHVLVIDRDNWLLYELYAAYPQNAGASWQAGSGPSGRDFVAAVARAARRQDGFRRLSEHAARPKLLRALAERASSTAAIGRGPAALDIDDILPYSNVSETSY
jgi:hypothetical protein